jgi:hypothetical protein
MILTAQRHALFSDLKSPYNLRSQIMFLGITMAILQIIDGVLTAIGVLHFGLAMEGNLFIRSLMAHLGIIPALIIIKLIAIGIVMSLCRLSSKIAWVSHAFTFLIPLYLGAAVVPWTWVICTKILFV